MTDSPPPSKSKWSSRMGTALRRSSTLLALSRPTTPSGNVGSDRDSETRSLRRSGSGTSLDKAAAPQAPAVSSPSPIAESPAREAAALQEPLGPSPLAQTDAAAAADTPSPAAAEEQTSPTGYVPPPVLDSTVGNPGAFTDDPDQLPKTQVVVDPYAVPPPAEEDRVEEPEAQPVFDKVMAESMESVESVANLASTTEDQGNTTTAAPAPVAAPVAVPGFSTAVMPGYELPSYNVWASGASQEAGKRPIVVPVAVAPSHRSQVSSIKLPNPHGPYEDPFLDPPAAAPYPEPVHHADENHGEAHPTMVMPLPAFDQVVGSRNVPHSASKQSLAEGKPHVNPETDERIPLLSRSTAGKYTPMPAPHVGPSSSWTMNGNTHFQLVDLGWIEYNLPDGTTYYSHLTKKLTTDLDLRSERILRAVNIWVEEHEEETTNIDFEGWLRESCEKAEMAKKKKKSSWGGKKGKKEEEPIFLERLWVDHQNRTVGKGGEHTSGYGRDHGYPNGHGHGKGKKQATSPLAKHVEEDHLDLEYRYWAFMECHPAHLPVSHRAKAEALDVLTWALTDRLLPSHHRSIPAPFTQDECQELRTILMSFRSDNEQGDNGIQTRIIARILLRVAHWRQFYFRPNKSLPKDVDFGNRALPIQRRPFRRALFDFVISCVFLGIPYFFLERVRLAGSARAADEESGLLRGQSPMFIMGACTCLMAAIVLSASVTFLSLPGLDGVTRTASMVAILFAAFAVAATGVAVLRHKADLERPISHLGVEGIVGISRRTIALSLPLVFLAYSIIAFVAGITLYTFRGKTVDNPLPKSPFEDSTRWIIVGVLGGLAGILTTSLLLLRR